MKKFVQIRITTSKSEISAINHDYRITKPDYLRDSLFHNKFENYYVGNIDEAKLLLKNSWQDYKNIRVSKGKRFDKKTLSNMIMGVITLSPSINLELEKDIISYDELNQLFLEAFQNVSEYISSIVKQKNIIVYSIAIHYDEKTPHLHFNIENHTNDGLSIMKKFKTSDNLSKLQDLVAEPFKKHGYSRGEKKSKAKHLSILEMHQAEIETLKNEKILIKQETDKMRQFYEDEIIKKYNEIQNRAAAKKYNKSMGMSM